MQRRTLNRRCQSGPATRSTCLPARGLRGAQCQGCLNKISRLPLHRIVIVRVQEPNGYSAAISFPVPHSSASPICATGTSSSARRPSAPRKRLVCRRRPPAVARHAGTVAVRKAASEGRSGPGGAASRACVEEADTGVDVERLLVDVRQPVEPGTGRSMHSVVLRRRAILSDLET